MADTNASTVAAGEVAKTGGFQEILVSFLPFVIIFAIFYFLFIRPQKTRQKKHNEMLEALKAGDKIVSYGGVMCEIVKKEDSYFVVRSEESTMRLAKEYIAYKVEQ